jgi:hypothetical protein
MWIVFLLGFHNKTNESSSNIQHLSESKTLLIDLSSEPETFTENGNSWVSGYKSYLLKTFFKKHHTMQIITK